MPWCWNYRSLIWTVPLFDRTVNWFSIPAKIDCIGCWLELIFPFWSMTWTFIPAKFVWFMTVVIDRWIRWLEPLDLLEPEIWPCGFRSGWNYFAVVSELIDPIAYFVLIPRVCAFKAMNVSLRSVLILPNGRVHSFERSLSRKARILGKRTIARRQFLRTRTITRNQNTVKAISRTDNTYPFMIRSRGCLQFV